MEIDFEKIGAVVERLEREISKGAIKAAVTIGAREGGNVFRLEVVCAEEAEEEDVAEVMDWARCIAPSNALGQEPCAAVCARSPAPLG